MTEDYDVIVIGAGSGGMAASKRAAKRGATVALIEGRTVGGTCVARGCMPKKFLYYASKRLSEVNANGPAGLQAEPTEISWSDIIDHELSVVEDLIQANREGVEDYDRIELIEGRARLLDKDTVNVNGESLTAGSIILATGSSPKEPPIDGAEYGIMSDDFLKDHTLPYSMGFVGGGYIAVEFASVLQTFGVDVTIFQRPETLLPNYDSVIGRAIEKRFEERGIDVNTGTEVQSIEKAGRSYHLKFNGDRQGSFTADRVLLAVGRESNTEDLGLDNIGLEPAEDKSIEVDDGLRTDVDSVYAVGDLNGRYPFTPVAIREGKIAAENAVDGSDRTVNYDDVPTAVFTQPQAGSVGLSEAKARKEHDSITVAKKSFKPFSAAVRREQGEVRIKLIYEDTYDRLIGLHVIGPDASEIVQGFGLALRQGVTMSDIKDFPGIHPTVAEEIFSTKPD
ncbi:MAG: NAD(P)/FAD-dependent oxidoreductase [bacterium]